MIESLYPPFRPWSSVGTIWIYSDPHFSDEDMVDIRKGYIGDDEQIARINSKVGRKDTLIILGDIGNEQMCRYLRGHKVLVMGNHDKGASKYADLFDEIYEGPVFIGEKLLLSHEPIILPFAFNIHGHVHNKNHKDDATHKNVCLDVIDYTPINLNKFLKSGPSAKVISIHRDTIDKATKRSQKRKGQK
jgi:calcineurin-like phosphoesterase family protein